MQMKNLRVAVLTIVVLVAGGGAAALADTTTTTTTTTDPSTTTTAPAPPPAPAGFADSLVSIYTEQYDAIQALAGTGSGLSAQQVPSPADFQQNVDSLNSEELAQLYAATQQPNSQWGSMASTYQQLEQDASGYAQGTGSSGATVASAMRSMAARGRAVARQRATARRVSKARQKHKKKSRHKRRTATKRANSSGNAIRAAALDGSAAANPFPPPEPTGEFPVPLGPFSPTSPVAATVTITCPLGAPGGPPDEPGDDAIYAAQLTLDVASSVASDVPDVIVIAGESIPDPAKYVAEAIQLAAAITLDTFNYVQGVANDCDTVNRDAFLANIDNTTLQLFALESQTIQPTLDAVQSSINTIHDQVHVVQQSIDSQLTLDIQQALSLSTSSPSNVDYILPASVGGNLDSTPIGVQEVVTNAFNAAKQAGLTINPIVGRDISAANSALGAGQYRTAWSDYQAAYQALGS